MSVTTKDGLLEAWVTQIEAMEQNLEALYGPPGITPVLPDVTNREGLLGAIAEQSYNAYINIAKVSGAYHDSVTNVYAMTLPSTLLDWFGIKVIGGKTIVWNQLNQNDTGSVTTKDVTFTKNANGSWDISGTASGEGSKSFGHVQIVQNHKYLIRGCPTGGSNSTFWISISGVEGRDYGSGDIITFSRSSGEYLLTFVFSGGAVISATGVRPQIFDLTLLCGAGNEPTTVQEFEQMFPSAYYEYNAGQLMSAGVTEVVSKDANNTTIYTYTIPAEVQALTDYGWSAGQVYNYIDFERKVFVQNVGSVDLGTLTWGYGPSVGWSATLPNVKNPADDDTAFNGLSATLKVTDRNTQATAFSGGTDAGMVSVAGGKVYVGTGSISIVPSGTLIYELDEPVETDISQYLTDDYISIEGGGTITFENQNGDDYRIPVPVKAEYIGV